jgi:hypothetical protein
MNVSPADELGHIKELKDGKCHVAGEEFTSSLCFRGTFWSLAVKTTHTLCQYAGERRQDKAGHLRYHGRVGPDRQDGRSDVPLLHCPPA